MTRLTIQVEDGSFTTDEGTYPIRGQVLNAEEVVAEAHGDNVEVILKALSVVTHAEWMSCGGK